MQTSLPLTRDLVLVGGGHAHALVLRMWGMRPLPGARVTLLNPGPAAPYTGMLPGHVAGHYTREELDIDLVRLARFAGARLIRAEVTGIDPQAREVTVQGRGRIRYDIASIDIGIQSGMPEIAGFAAHGVPVKPLDLFADRWRDFLDSAARGQVAPEVAVIGGGVAGLETALGMDHALRQRGLLPAVTVIEAATELAPGAPALRRELAPVLARAGIACRTGARVTRVTATGVELDGGESIPARFVVGAAGARPWDWLAGTSLPLTEEGFIRTASDLRVEGCESLFAAGDCAHLLMSPRPKAGVFAVRAVPVLAHNLRVALSGGRMRRFRPQRHYLKLVSLGDKAALAEKWGLTVKAPILWHWKDRIDQRFMQKFRDLPDMPAPRLPRRMADGVTEVLGDRPLCGGCGSKVGPGTLAGALATLPQPARADVLTGPGDDAAVLSLGGVRQVVTTDHLRAFTEDWGLMARIAAIHALGDVWAMGAHPQAALLSVILPRMSDSLQSRTMEEILREASAVFAAEGAEIVGGHSTTGAELTIGFTVTGLLAGLAIGQGSARVGDALILTRPIGSGTVLAAEMRGRARGRDVAQVLDAMARPQGDAAAILGGAHAMTDVTGFGLAGHLWAICRASGTAARIDLDAVPLYPGAEELAKAGEHSTIRDANRAAAPVFGAEGARGDLLYDPQTAGGFLAAVPAEEAAVLVARLRAAGHPAAVIGEVTEGPPSVTCR